MLLKWMWMWSINVTENEKWEFHGICKVYQHLSNRNIFAFDSCRYVEDKGINNTSEVAAGVSPEEKTSENNIWNLIITEKATFLR